MEYINHPIHYQGKSIEVIEIIDEFELSFSLGNVIKYILRSKKKGNQLQDLEKAKWYLEHEINKLKPQPKSIQIPKSEIDENFVSELNG